MESYPGEFTAHLHPLLLIAGLGPAVVPPPKPGALGVVEPDSRASLDPFAALVTSLRQALLPKRSFQFWDNSRGSNHDFHVVLAEKNMRFPPLKARPSASSEAPLTTLHSPISPLSPSSPLYPDGIIAPIWIRKHREMVPAVFVLVLRLTDVPHVVSSNPLVDNRPGEDSYDRTTDGELVREIMERKRSTMERGIKLAVVLMCSRELLDDPSLDSRLGLIRRQSGLDMRASLFVISPAPPAEIVQFVKSLKTEVFPAALDYYREHGRRVRRKKARQVSKGKLSDKGWMVRSDFKLATFSEMRGEIEVALKHYEDCYDTLIEMFAASPPLLVLKSKRWAEAKVLADCLNVKIAKFHLYTNDPAGALAQLNGHLARFRELSSVWGTGEKTFEWWSWISKQYRLFAELVNFALRAGFRLPLLIPPSASSGQTASSSALIPSRVLQHPGFYFYLAGLYAVQRRDRFRAIAKNLPQDGAPVSLAIAHESKVDHAEMIIDLFTKAYEIFRIQRTSRMALLTASNISLAYYEAGNFDMVLQFQERIERVEKNYRKEGWRALLDSTIQLTFEAALRTGAHPTAIRAALDLISPDSLVSVEKRANYATRLLEILRTPCKPEEETLISFGPTDVAPLFECCLVFWQSTSEVRKPVPFQLSLHSPPNSRSSSLNFSAFEIQFNDGREPVIIRHAVPAADTSAGVEIYSMGTLGDGSSKLEEATAPLSWPDGSTKIFEGTVEAREEISLTITSVTLGLCEGDRTVRINLPPRTLAPLGRGFVWQLPGEITSSVRIPHLSPSNCIFGPRKVRIDVGVTHEAPAYLNEEFPIHVNITNQDDIEAEVVLDIEMQPGEGTENTGDLLLLDSKESSTSLNQLSLGLLPPGSSLRKTFRLLSTHTLISQPTSARHLLLTVRSRPSPPPDSTDVYAFTEIVQPLEIEVKQPLQASLETSLHQRRRPAQLLNLGKSTGWEGARDATVVAKILAMGPWEIEVVGIRLDCKNSPKLRIMHSSLDGETKPLSLIWNSQDCFNVIFQMEAAAVGPGEPVEGAFLEILWRRQGTTASSRTTFPLPPFQPSPLQPSITLRIPPFLTLNQLCTLTYRFSNPTSRLITLSTEVENSVTFVFAGPRSFAPFVLAPNEEREMLLNVIPLMVGSCALPRFRAFEHQTRVGEEKSPVNGPGGKDIRFELNVVGETDSQDVKDPGQVGLEGDLRVARGLPREVEEWAEGERSGIFTVLILPR